MREWEQFIPEEERKIYEKAGYKNKDAFGRNPIRISKPPLATRRSAGSMPQTLKN